MTSDIKRKVMDDLDSLLADLHSSQATPNITPNMYSDEPIYEQTNYTLQHVNKKQGPPTVPKPTRNTLPRTGYNQHMSTEKEPMFNNTTNLSQLDTLLDDLNATQIGPNPIIITSPSPPASANMTNYEEQQSFQQYNTTSSDGHNTGYSHYEQVHSSNMKRDPAQVQSYQTNDLPVSYSSEDMTSSSFVNNQRTASNATRELDDLLASLSDFKVTDQRAPPRSAVIEPAVSRAASSNYSQGQSQGSTAYSSGAEQSFQVTSNVDTELFHDPVQGYGDIDTMMSTMSHDLSKEGINTLPKGHCAACNKLIVGQVITALGRIWHPEHFVCCECDTELGTCNFFERDLRPYCEVDYHKLFSPKCAHCQGPILDKCVTALNNTWHPEHFVCAKCGQAFGESGFHERNGLPYCRNDYFEMFAPKCGGCSNPIMDNFISAIGKQWHPDCFICQDCHKPFGVGSFFEHNALPYCETHYHEKRGSLCASCQQPISGRCITAMYRKFHPEHFTCTFCQRALNKGTFKEQNDKAYCHPCFQKLFG